MSFLFQIQRRKVKIQSDEITIVALKQKDLSIIVREELGRLLLIDTADCREMFLLASLIKHSMDSHDVLFFEREDDTKADLFIFNGAITPLTAKDLRKIKTSLRFIKPETYNLTLIDSYDDSIWDTWEHWKYDKSLKVKAERNSAYINASQLGFELLARQCAYLASSFSGHVHFDWHSTKSSIELLIRNMARNY